MALLGRGAGVRFRGRAYGQPALFGYAALAGVVGFWAWRALHDPGTYDEGIAYVGGQVAWASAHPEVWLFWTGTPLYAAMMAVVSRAMGAGTASNVLTVVNVVLAVATVLVVLRRLRGVLSPAWWWITAAALVSFGPVMSTVWWKQINIVPIVLAVGGFELLRRQRMHLGGALIGLSVAIKPLVILLPLVLLARRGTRRAGVWALAYLVGLSVVAKIWLAVHAHSGSALSPLLEIENFANKSTIGTGLRTGCWPENFAPGSLLCHVAGTQDPTLQRIVALVGVALLGALVIGALRGWKATSWDVFAFTCALSPMVSSIEWSHYQIALAPLFVLLVVRFSRDGASWGEWAGLAVAFLLASLVWRPYDTPIGVARSVVVGIAQFAQYVLIITGVIWYSARRGSIVPPEVSPDAALARVVSGRPDAFRSG